VRGYLATSLAGYLATRCAGEEHLALLTKKTDMILTKLLILGTMLLPLGQVAGNIDTILGTVMGIIARVSYVIAFCMFIYGCVRARSDLGEAVTPIGIAVLIAIGAIVLDTLFTAGGLPVIRIGQ
jgi:hypothetical protein